MAYQYVSMIITSTEASYAIDQFVEKIKEIVPNLTAEGPFYYQDEPETYPEAKTYILTHSADPSFKLVLYNSSSTDTAGKPSSGTGYYNKIAARVIAGEVCTSLGEIHVGTGLKTTSSVGATNNIIYITLLAGVDYLLWYISSTPPSINVPLYVGYIPLYDVDGSIYALSYPGLYGYYKGNSSGSYFNTFKDTLLTSGGISPGKAAYGLSIKRLNRYVYPQMDITQNGTEENYKPTLTKNVQMYIETIYGSSSSMASTDTNRVISTHLRGRECILAMAKEQSPTYPEGGILTLDGKDYYICDTRSVDSSKGFCTYILFEL